MIQKSVLMVLGLCLWLSMPVRAADPLPKWVIDMQKSSLSFSAVQQGAPITGSFGAFSGDIYFDASRPEESTAIIHIDMKSVDTKSPERDESLIGPDWLGVQSFPEAVYSVAKFEKTGEGGQYLAKGELNFHGVKKALDLPLKITFSKDGQGQEVALAEGEVMLNRLDFNVGWPDTQSVGNPVAVKVSVRAIRQ